MLYAAILSSRSPESCSTRASRHGSIPGAPGDDVGRWSSAGGSVPPLEWSWP